MTGEWNVQHTSGQVQVVKVGGQDITHLIKHVQVGMFGDDAPAEPAVKLSPDQRRTQRQRQAIANGVHPLGLVVPGVSVHLEVLVGGQNYTCGDCRFRQLQRHHDTTHPKCTFGAREVHRVGYEGKGYQDTEYPRISRGAGTDVRAYWPACSNFEVSE